MRILVVRIGRAGDIIMTTPALKALLDCFPDARFTLLTSPDGNRLLRNYHERIDDIWVWDRSSLGSFIEKNRIKSRLKSTSFDKIVCFETSPSIAKLFNNLSADFYYSQGLGRQIHTAQSYLDIIGAFCPANAQYIKANLPVTEEAIQLVDNELSVLNIKKDDVIIGLHPTYSGFSTLNLRKRSARKHKLWPAENFGQLSQQLSKIELSSGRQPKILIDLLDKEMPLGKKIIDHSQGCVQLINTKPNIERYKALLKRYDLLVAPDTGPMHMAAAVGTRLVALFSGKDPSNCGPFTDKDMFTILQSENTSIPDMGISAIDVKSVFDACISQLRKI